MIFVNSVVFILRFLRGHSEIIALTFRSDFAEF